MSKSQWIVVGLAILIVIGIYAATEKQIFGPSKNKTLKMEVPGRTAYNTDSVLYNAKKHLSAEQVTRLNLLEQSISRGDVKDQQLHLFHQLAQFWADTARAFEPYAWYTAEAARLENSEKSLTFAARLFLNNFVEENNSDARQWEALQAEDLFKRSLKLNPANDSSKIGLGETYVYGGIVMPMQGIGLIREVVERDSLNTYAQMALGKASLTSGQMDKALNHFKKVVQMHPDDLEAVIRMAETNEQMGNKEEAIKWYERTLSLTNIPAIKEEVEMRLNKLKIK